MKKKIIIKIKIFEQIFVCSVNLKLSTYILQIYNNKTNKKSGTKKVQPDRIKGANNSRAPERGIQLNAA